MATVVTASHTSSSRIDERRLPNRAGFFTRLVQAIMQARQRAADREIAEILGRRGGIMRDELESGAAPAVGREYPFRQLPSLNSE